MDRNSRTRVLGGFELPECGCWEECRFSVARVVLFLIDEQSLQILLFLSKVKGTWKGHIEYGNCFKFWF